MEPAGPPRLAGRPMVEKEHSVASNESGVNNEMTVIGRETTIRGEIDFEQSARIMGHFEGKIRSRGEVQIGETAQCRAEVDAVAVVVEGTLEGNINAHDRLRIGKTAHLTGDICAPKLQVDEGATFVGHCRVGDAAAEGIQARSVPTAASRPPTAPATQPAPRTEPAAIDFKPPWRERAEADAKGEATPIRAGGNGAA